MTINRYFYLPGDEVVHIENPNMKGTITEQLTADRSGHRVHKMNVKNQWYTIKWTDVPEGMEPFEGFEHLESLCPSFITLNATMILRNLFQQNRPLWNEVVKYR